MLLKRVFFLSGLKLSHLIRGMYKTTYDKTICQTGIIHVGYGAFHRAHQAVYIDDYMEKTGDLRWGIVAVNLRNEGFREIDDYVLKKIGRAHV